MPHLNRLRLLLEARPGGGACSGSWQRFVRTQLADDLLDIVGKGLALKIQGLGFRDAPGGVDLSVCVCTRMASFVWSASSRSSSCASLNRLIRTPEP